MCLECVAVCAAGYVVAISLASERGPILLICIPLQLVHVMASERACGSRVCFALGVLSGRYSCAGLPTPRILSGLTRFTNAAVAPSWVCVLFSALLFQWAGHFGPCMYLVVCIELTLLCRA